MPALMTVESFGTVVTAQPETVNYMNGVIFLDPPGSIPADLQGILQIDYANLSSAQKQILYNYFRSEIELEFFHKYEDHPGSSGLAKMWEDLRDECLVGEHQAIFYFHMSKAQQPKIDSNMVGSVLSVMISYPQDKIYLLPKANPPE